MVGRTLAALMLVSVAGCGSQPRWEPQDRQDLFNPTAMRIHPVFTQLADWSGDGKPDGVEVLIEFQDRFGDPTKASGSAVFEIYQYRPGYPDPRGARLVEPYLVAVDNIAAQRDHWNRTSRCYSFQLAWLQANPAGTYVMTSTFELAGGKRFADQIVLEPQVTARKMPATSPANQPGVRSSTP